MKTHYKKPLFFALICFLLFYSCKKDTTNLPETALNRPFLMGFQSSAPRIDFDLTIQSLHLWEQRADAAIITTEVPWDSLYSGSSAVEYVNTNYKNLVSYYRTKGFKLWVYIDPANGLNRASDATALTKIKKSIAQHDVQNIYKRFVFVMDSVLNPEHLGLALETNMIRDFSPDSIYQGIRIAANNASTEIRAYDKKVKLSISVQVDHAWGKFDNLPNKTVDKDFSDFPFIEELGLSSYPYFAFDKPEDIPLNYYSKLLINRTLPVFISEGGWSSASVDKVVSTPEKQRDYINRQAQLVNEVNCIAVFQLTFTDLDLAYWPANIPSNLSLFASLGLVDINLNPKPALVAWDSIYSRKYTGN